MLVTYILAQSDREPESIVSAHPSEQLQCESSTHPSEEHSSSPSMTKSLSAEFSALQDIYDSTSGEMVLQFQLANLFVMYLVWNSL